MVTTLMSNTRKVGFFAPDPVSYARAAVATIGIQRYTHGYWTHALQVYYRLSTYWITVCMQCCIAEEFKFVLFVYLQLLLV